MKNELTQMEVIIFGVAFGFVFTKFCNDLTELFKLLFLIAK